MSTTEAQGQTQWAQPEYDARGNPFDSPSIRCALSGSLRAGMITVPKPDSPASAFTCTWDAWNRLVEVKDGETTVAQYAYDGLNHRITKTVGATITHAYYNSGWQLLETREGAGAPESLQPKYQFVWSVRYIDAPVLRDKNTDDDGECDDERLHFTNDANMNVTALLDTDGTVVERYAYTPYGKPSFFDASWNPRAESAYDNAILYCGYYYDNETGLYHVRERYYHPILGRWLSRDLVGYVDGMSLYEFLASLAIWGTDPWGLAATKEQCEEWARDWGLTWTKEEMLRRRKEELRKDFEEKMRRLREQRDISGVEMRSVEREIRAIEAALAKLMGTDQGKAFTWAERHLRAAAWAAAGGVAETGAVSALVRIGLTPVKYVEVLTTPITLTEVGINLMEASREPEIIGQWFEAVESAIAQESALRARRSKIMGRIEMMQGQMVNLQANYEASLRLLSGEIQDVQKKRGEARTKWEAGDCWCVIDVCKQEGLKSYACLKRVAALQGAAPP